MQEVAEGIDFFWIWQHLHCLWPHLFAAKSRAVGMGLGLSVVFQPCGTWWLQSSACSSWCFQMLLIHSLFPCSPSRVCAAKLSELAGFLTVRALQMRGCTCSKARGKGGSAQPAPPRGPAGCAGSPAARPSPALAFNQREFCASALANLLWFRAVEPAVCNLM